MNSVMLVNASSLIGTSTVTLMLGFPYWGLAARLFPPEAVGLGSATISAMTLLGTFCILGMGTLLMGELSRQRGKEGSLISAALILVGGVGACIGVAFALIAPALSKDFQQLRGGILNVGLFALGVSLAAITVVLDQSLVGLLKSNLQFWRNTFFAIAKLVVIFFAGLLLSRSYKVGMTIYATWTIGNLLSLLALATLATVKGVWSRGSYRPHWGLLRKLGPAALQHHMLNLTLQAPSLILPVLVTVLLSAKTNAWFYVSWMIANLASLVPYVLSTVLFATTSTQPELLPQKARITLGIAVVVSILMNCIICVGSKRMLGLFGPAYASQAEWSLRILVLGAFPRIIKDHYVAICRIQGRVVRAALPMMFGGVLEVGIAALGAHFAGLAGLSLGWVIAVCAEAGFGFYTVYKAVRLGDVLVYINQLLNMFRYRLTSEMLSKIGDNGTRPADPPDFWQNL
jgi:O-antigen/teichoic acid export membrane protein